MQMNRMMGLGALALCGIAITYSCAARAPLDRADPEPRSIAVSGNAQVHVVPDEVVLTFGVESFDRKLATARQQNQEAVARVLQVARDSGVEERYLHTDHISVQPEYDHYVEGKLVGYRVRQTITATLEDVGRFEDLLTGVLEAGANHVHGVQFQTTELRTHKDRARELAVQAAREKADAMAAELGQRVGEPLLIEEQPGGAWSPYGSYWGWGGTSYSLANCNYSMEAPGVAADAGSAIAPGQITVSGVVRVRFELL